MQKNLKYRNITISGKVAVGTTTLAKNLQHILGWKYINTGALQRKWDRKRGVNENEHGALLRPDDHERKMEELAHKTLIEENKVIYEAWLAGFVAQDIAGILKLLLICSNDAVRIDRVMNRDEVTADEAKRFIRTREDENIVKWHKIYGKHDFWNPKYYDLVIDTYSKGAMETLGVVLDKLGYRNHV